MVAMLPGMKGLYQPVKWIPRLFKSSCLLPYPEATVSIKMHLLEDHEVQWANTYHAGFGLLGEQGAELIHAKFNRLGLVFVPICCA